MLVKYVYKNKNLWDQYIDTCVYAYNSSKHESTAYTPFELMFGRKARLPIDIEIDEHDPEELIIDNDAGEDHEAVQAITDQRIARLEIAKDNIKTAQAKQKRLYDEKHACPDAFVVGALVLKRDARRKKRAGGKLDTKYTGPYKITKCLSKGIYSLQKVDNPSDIVKRVSGADLKPYHKATDYSIQSVEDTDCSESDSREDTSGSDSCEGASGFDCSVHDRVSTCS